MTVTVTPTPADGSDIGAGDVLSFALSESADGVHFSVIMIFLGEAFVGPMIYNSSGGFAAGYSGTDSAYGNQSGTVTISADAGWPTGSQLFSVRAFADFDGNVFPFTFNITGGGGGDGGETQQHTTPEITDHCQRAINRLISKFKSKPNWQAYICALADSAQDIEQALADMEAFRSLATAYGIGLDRIGQILSLPRDGLEDEPYRARLVIMASIVGSGGAANEMQDVLLRLDDGFQPSEVTYEEPEPATVIMHCQVAEGYVDDGRVFARFLHRIKPVGVRMILEFEEHGVVWFEFARVGGGTPPTGSGWTRIGGDPQGVWRHAADGS